MDDVITLIRPTYTTTEAGQILESLDERREVICRRREITRSEYYQAAQAGLAPEYVFILSHFSDYQKEPKVEYTDEFGDTKLYTVTRLYRPPESDELEITVTAKLDDVR